MFRLIFFVKVVIIICIPFLFIHCGEFCPLDDYKKNLLVQANQDYGNYLILKPIECENRYIRCYLKKDRVDTLTLKKLNKSLYDEKKGGWQSMIIYDTHKNFLFCYHYSGNISMEYDL